MERFPYKRVAVIGCSGGGKSTFSRALRDKVGLPLYHLDAIYWKADRTTLPKEEFRAIQRKIIEKNEWIIDGNYGSTIEWRIAACDILFFLDYPAEVCLAGVRARRGQKRSDMPWVEEEFDPEFREWIIDLHKNKLPALRELLKENEDKKSIVTFHSRADADSFIDSLRQKSFS